MNVMSLRSWGPVLAVSAMLLIAGAASNAPLAGAQVGTSTSSRAYGPPQPAGGTPPGGYSAVVTSQTVGTGGGFIGPVGIDGVNVTLAIPAGAFPVPVQITLTVPNLAAVGDAGLRGYAPVAGVGVQVQENGAAYPGTFLKPVTLTMQSSLIISSSVVVVWNGKAFVADPDSTVTAGTSTVSFDADPDFALLSPTAATGAPIPGATKSVTGEPFAGQGILAAVLLLLGTGGLIAARRRARA